ncbi:MAG: hypothetical protein SGILL_010648 [Bacillariaceae sp.]
MKKMVMGERNDPVSSGILVEMDGKSPIYGPPMPQLSMAAYFLAAMSGFLAFLIFFGCILICAQLGFITAQPDERGRIVLFAGGQGVRNMVVRVARKNLLTRDQVMKLDEEEFVQEPTGDDDEACCCAVCLDDFEDKEKHILDSEKGENGCDDKADGGSLTETSHVNDEIDGQVGQPSMSTFWHRLRVFRGWTLVTEAENDLRLNESQDEEDHNASISEIEMESRTSVHSGASEEI